MYQSAMDMATEVNEKRMVLSGLARVQSFDAMQMAAAYLDDKSLQQEAEVAVVALARYTMRSHPQETRAIIEKVAKMTQNKSLQRQVQRFIR